jgi:hypothetical protein
MRAFLLLISIPVFFLTGCTSSRSVSQANLPDASLNTDYSLIYIIHGDANYLYHEEGKSILADKKALHDAIDIARKAYSGEVFIFHQKPERKILGIFPKKDRVLYHFVNGQLITQDKYSPKDGGFTKESQLYNMLTVSKSERKFFVYLGHEVPTFSDQNYHASEPDFEFDTDVFSDHISDFSSTFDLTIVSTCNNANPKFIDSLSDKTKYLIASSQNLHLSYLNLEDLGLLEGRSEIETGALADSIAQRSFNDLSEKLQTMVTVGVYDMSVVGEYSKIINSTYSEYLEDVSAKPRFTDNIDCATIPSLQPLISSNGIKHYYKPAAFGRKAAQKTHSGWGCKE